MTESATTDDRPLTIDEFERLPDDGWRLELVRGRVVREPPAGFRHGSLAGRLSAFLHRFAEEHDLGVVVTADAGFVLAETPPTVRAPDVAFVSTDRIPPEGAPIGFARFPPDLAIEIVSPSNTMSEIQTRVLDYLEAGSAVVWVVDPGSRTVVVYRAPDEIRLLRPGDRIEGGGLLPGFGLAVDDLFD